MKKIILSIILILIGVLILVYSQSKNTVVQNETKIKKLNSLSIMVEKEVGSGKYNEVNEFPQDGYVLNQNLSKCLNGSKIKYENGSLTIKGTKTDYCYAYFDYDELGSLCLNQNMAKCFTQNYKKDSSIIYHDGKADYEGMENYNLEAEDLSYRYTGANPNNYVCFGSACSNVGTSPNYKNLYRIIGLFKNDSDQYEMKIIKADAATKEDLGEGTYPESAYYGKYTWGDSNYKGKNYDNLASYYWNSTSGTSSSDNNVNMWAASNLNTNNLNQTYYNAIEEPYKAMVVEHEWQVGGYSNSRADAKGTYDQELGDNKLTSSSQNCYDQGNTSTARECNQPNDLTYKAHVGLMYISDYMYGTIPSNWTTAATSNNIGNNNWLYLGIYEWTISRFSTFGHIPWSVNSWGHAHNTDGVYGNSGARPVLYLSSDVKITGGSGTDADPFTLAY